MYRAGKAHNSERAHTMRRALYFAAVSRLPGDCRDAQGFMTEGRSWSQEVAGGRVFKTAFARWGGSDEANFSFNCSAIMPFVVLALSVPSLLSASANCCVSGLSDTSKYCKASRVSREARGKDDSLLPYRCSAFRPFIFPREKGVGSSGCCMRGRASPSRATTCLVKGAPACTDTAESRARKTDSCIPALDSGTVRGLDQARPRRRSYAEGK